MKKKSCSPRKIAKNIEETFGEKGRVQF